MSASATQGDHNKIISPPSFIRQASSARLMLCRCYFLSYSFFFFSNRLEQKHLGNYKTDPAIFTKFSGLVDMLVQMFNLVLVIPIGEGTLPWQPILGAKSAEIGDTPSFLGLAVAFHNVWQDGKADGRVNSAEVMSTARKK